MKKLQQYSVAFIIFCCVGCSNPFICSNTDKAVSERKQIDLLAEQNRILERIAVALEGKDSATKKVTYSLTNKK